MRGLSICYSVDLIVHSCLLFDLDGYFLTFLANFDVLLIKLYGLHYLREIACVSFYMNIVPFPKLGIEINCCDLRRK